MEYKLTQYSHGAGCGCKISPAVLDEILHKSSEIRQPHFGQLLVGNDTRDDAAVYDLGDGTAVISTTDFFMPIVDDPFDFGRIASVNAISDIYAMGGTPLVAIAILGWPIDKLPAGVAGKVMDGARDACSEADIPLGGGHSIDSPEPIFGLAVTGRVNVSDLKRNSGARPGDVLFLTKPLGVGILTTAQKKQILKAEHFNLARDSMIRLNKVGVTLAGIPEVHAMTDVTGFGLGGHLLEMCQSSNVHADISEVMLPLLDAEAINYYLDKGAIPGGTNRNFASYGEDLSDLSDRQKALICDPQTSGGLLVAVDPDYASTLERLLASSGLHSKPIGRLLEAGEGKPVSVT
jgi:selenide,water dikinase